MGSGAPRGREQGGPPRRAGRLGAAVGLFAVACGVALVAIEGASSLLLLLGDLTHRAPPVQERRHTRYDPELGWVNVPDLRLPDFYGPGRDLTINAQGFRGTRDVSPAPAPDSLRVVCSGDSFTLGFGVDDDETWCARLAALDPRIEPVNLGQGGYGVGQAYLWYRRDGARLAPRLHVFAFIGGDFQRLLSDRFLGYGKPRLRVRDGRLVTENVPVPSAAYALPWLVAHRDALAQLRSWQLLSRLLGRVRPPPELAAQEELAPLVGAIFDELSRLAAEQQSALLLVYIPMQTEPGVPASLALRRLLRDLARERGIPYLDLTRALRRLSPREAASLYIAPSDGEVDGAAGHLNARGHAWVAEHLMPRVQRLLAAPR